MRPVYIAVFGVSIGLIAFEVSLLQILSVVQWHHFASLIISIALLGFGASGAVLSLARRWMLERFDRIVPTLSAACSITIALSVSTTQADVVRFDSYLVFVQVDQALALVLTCLVLSIPFLLGALVIGLTFMRFTTSIGRLYLWNLVGSGIGGALGLLLMWILLPQAIAPITGAVVAVCAYPAARRHSRSSRIAVAVAILVCVSSAVYAPSLRPSQFKDVARANDLPDAELVYKHSSPLGLVEVVSAPAARSAPGLSLKYSGDVPVNDLVFVNGDAVGSLPHSLEDARASLYAHTTRMLPYAMAPIESVLVLSSGTGEAARHAVSQGVREVTAVEPNHQLTGLWSVSMPNVRTPVVAARTWLESDTMQYDLIVFPDVGRFGGTVGLEEMEENYLMTQEALRAAWNRLRPEGRISVTVWMDYPYRAPLQVLSSLVDAVESEIPAPGQHIAAIRSWADVTFAVSRSPIGETASDSIRALCQRKAFDPLLLPNIERDERTHFNDITDEALLDYVDRLVGPSSRTFIDTYPFIIAPVTDDRPFAMHFLRWSAVPELVRSFGDRTTPFFGLGLFIAVLGLIVSAALSLVLIIVPLLALKSARAGSPRTLIYFAALGLSYFFVEIAFIQRFTLFLGHPVYAATAVIAFMLIGSGLGSYASIRLGSAAQTVSKAVVVVSAIVLAYIPLLDLVLGHAISLPIMWRAVVSLVLIMPPAFAMGFPFPLGLSLVATVREEQLAWVWGVNGCFSVIGAAGAGILALEFGFTAVLASAAALYVLAALTIRRYGERPVSATGTSKSVSIWR